ncbi:hypothetical protein D6792_02810 [Candidatus Parcubacteria bacterium]|nr:MAG: hypothetical protein D6792_02810 [Candidatus Parcubacteria bacterium]
MDPFFAFALALHVAAGLAGCGGAYAAWFALSGSTPAWRTLWWGTAFALVGFFMSYASGAVYYLSYYGKAVKPVILQGRFPWAHAFAMEAKEHLFLFLPFVTLLLAVAIWRYNKLLWDSRNIALREALAALAGVVAAIAFIVVLLGVLVSGAVR